MAFRFDKLTIKAQEAVQRAQELAADAGNPQLEPLHLLAALLAEQDGVVRPLLERIGVNQTQLQQIVAAELGHLPKSNSGTPPQLGKDLSTVLESAQSEAETMQDDCYLISSDGWTAGNVLREIRKVKNKKGSLVWPESHEIEIEKRRYKSDLIPKPLIVARYFAKEQQAIDAVS